MAINIEYENWRQQGDPLQKPPGWTPDLPHAVIPETDDSVIPLPDEPSSPINSTDDIRKQMETDLTNFQQEIDDYQASLKSDEEQAVANLESSFGQQIRSTTEKNKAVTGQRTMFLAGTGALGRTLAGQSNLVQLENAQQAEIQALEQKKQSAINSARAAYRTKDFELMKYSLAEVAKIKKEASDLIAAQEEARIARAKETREEMEFKLTLEEKQKALQKTTAENLASGLVNFKLSEGTVDVPDQTELESIAAEYDIDPLILMRAMNDRMDDVRKIQKENFKDYFTLAKSIEEGQEVQAPDGTIIKGIKSKADNIITYEATINGRKYKVGANKATGEVQWQNPIGSGGGGGGSNKTVTWAQAKELGDLSLYGQPIAEIYKAKEDLNFEEWLLQKNLQDPMNYPLMSFDVDSPIYNEYADYLLSNTSPAENLENKLYLKENPEEAESLAIDIINENASVIDSGEETPENLIQFIIQSTGLSYAKAKSIVNDQLGL